MFGKSADGTSTLTRESTFLLEEDDRESVRTATHNEVAACSQISLAVHACALQLQLPLRACAMQQQLRLALIFVFCTSPSPRV